MCRVWNIRYTETLGEISKNKLFYILIRALLGFLGKKKRVLRPFQIICFGCGVVNHLHCFAAIIFFALDDYIVNVATAIGACLAREWEVAPAHRANGLCTLIFPAKVCVAFWAGSISAFYNRFAFTADTSNLCRLQKNTSLKFSLRFSWARDIRGRTRPEQTFRVLANPLINHPFQFLVRNPQMSFYSDFLSRWDRLACRLLSLLHLKTYSYRVNIC